MTLQHVVSSLPAGSLRSGERRGTPPERQCRTTSRSASSRSLCAPSASWAARLRCRAQRGNARARTARPIFSRRPAGQRGGLPYQPAPPVHTRAVLWRSFGEDDGLGRGGRPAFEFLALRAARFVRAALELEVHQVADPGCGAAAGIGAGDGWRGRGARFEEQVGPRVPELVVRRAEAVFRLIDRPAAIAAVGEADEEPRPDNCRASQRGGAALDSFRSVDQHGRR